MLTPNPASDSSSAKEASMVDNDEAVIEKIDYYANKVNVFFAMRPAIETLNKLVTDRKNIVKMLNEGKCDDDENMNTILYDVVVVVNQQHSQQH